MTNAPSGQPHPDPTLLEQLRRRALKDDLAWFDGAKVLARNPFARGVARLLRIDLEPFDRAVRDSDRSFETVAISIGLFAERGWAPSGLMPIPVYEGAIKLLADSGSVDAAEDALVDGWNHQGVLPYLHHRVLGLGLGKDEEVEGWYRERGRLIRCAWGHHQEGSYEASIPIVFAEIDGITADATISAATPAGRMFFSTHPTRQADVVDDITLAGMNDALPVVRNYFSGRRDFTGATGSGNRAASRRQDSQRRNEAAGCPRRANVLCQT